MYGVPWPLCSGNKKFHLFCIQKSFRPPFFTIKKFSPPFFSLTIRFALEGKTSKRGGKWQFSQEKIVAPPPIFLTKITQKCPIPNTDIKKVNRKEGSLYGFLYKQLYSGPSPLSCLTFLLSFILRKSEPWLLIRRLLSSNVLWLHHQSWRSPRLYGLIIELNAFSCST